MHLYGSYTSPYVRRIRHTLLDHGVPFTLVDVINDAEGQAALRARNPLWKVPTLDLGPEEDGGGDPAPTRVLWDSEVILDFLFDRYGHGSLRVPTSTTVHHEARLRATLQELSATMVKLFYVRRDGLDPSTVPYLQKDSDRVDATFAWLETQVAADGSCLGPDGASLGGFGRTELTLYTLLDWVRFRSVKDLTPFPTLQAFLAENATRPLLQETAPPV